MVCQHCRCQVATIHIQKITKEGKLRDQWLCAECASRLGLLPAESKWFTGEINPYRTYRQQEDSCPVCGMTFSQLMAGGAPGCSRCFSVYHRQLRSIIQKMHGLSSYAGKQPEQSYALRIVRRENQALISQGELLRLSLYQKQREMEKAVEKQDFERAALLRDEIRAMQEKEKNHGTDL